MIVEEATSDHPDTVCIKIDHPIETDQAAWGTRPRNIIYGAVVGVYNDFLQQIKPPNPSNIIKLYNPKRLSIQEVRIVAYPILHEYDGFILSNYIESIVAVKTETYYVKSFCNHLNHFVVNIPDLTEGFLRYRRLRRDFVKIVNPNELEWDGRIFKKKSN